MYVKLTYLFYELFLGLDHQANVHKMKLLTVMSLAEDSSIISFETIQQQVQVNADQVEPFLLERKIHFIFIFCIIPNSITNRYLSG